MDCISTHGGSGYAPGSYWDVDDIICGFCGVRIQNPPPIGSKLIWVWDTGFLGKLHLKGYYIEIPRYPTFIGRRN